MTIDAEFGRQLDQVVQGARKVLREQVAPSGARSIDEQPLGAFHAAASVLSTFDRSTLQPVPNGEVAIEDEEIVDVLADSAPVLVDGRTQWKLLTDVRRDSLRRLGRREQIERALDANSGRRQDLVQSTFESYVRGTARPLDQQTAPELAATFEVAQWLEDLDISLGSALPALADIRSRNDYLTLFQPFDDLAGKNFAGREGELSQLRDYVGVLKPGSPISGLVRGALKFLNLLEKPPLMIHGPGGVGKSALIARFIWEHQKVPNSQRFPFVYLDFDRAGVRSEEPLTLMIESVRQFALEYSEPAHPKVREHSDSIRLEWQGELIGRYQDDATSENLADLSIAAAPQYRGPSEQDDWVRYSREFGELLRKVRGGKDPCLFVLDTFEEVQYQGEEVTRELTEFLKVFQREVPRLRIVIAGRVPLEIAGLPIEPLPVGDFDDRAANVFLETRGVASADLRKKVIKRIGKSPLSLLLAAKVIERARQSGEEESFDLEVGDWKDFNEERIQGELYRRILKHIQDPQVASLAYPGLALRRVTPDIIRLVLAEPCQVDVPDDATATDLFNRLAREVTLVRIEEGALVHRRDVRRIMLPLVRESEKDAVKRIDEAAVAYYEARGGSVDRAEEIYHRLARHEAFDVVAERWDVAAKRYLYNALDPNELGARERAWLLPRMDKRRRLAPDERQAADLETWEWDTEQRVLDLLEKNRLSAASDALRLRPERSLNSPLFALEVDVLERQGDLASALEVCERAIAATNESGDRGQRIDFLCRAAALDIRMGKDDEALKRIELAESLLTPRADDGPRSLRLGMTKRELHRRGHVVLDEADIDDEAMRSRFEAVTDAQLVANADLALWAARDLDETHEPLRRVVGVLGLDLRPGESRALARALALWDDAVSRAADKWKGHLAGGDLPWSETLTQAWTLLIRQDSSAAVGARLANLLRDPTPSPDVIDTLYEIISDRAGDIGRYPDEPDSERARGSAAVPSIEATATYGDAGDRLSRRQFGDLHEALLDAFPSQRELAELVRFRLGRSIDSISFGESLPIIVFQLIDAAVKQKWVGSLVTAALESRPGNSLLLRVAEQLGLATEVPSDKRIDKVVHDRGSLLDVTAWRSKLGLLEPRVCRIEVHSADARRLGTGFLFGPDVLLTAYNVVSEVIEGRAKPSDVRLRFDYKQLRDGATVNPGVTYPLVEGDWLACSSAEALPTPRESSGVPVGSGLNYALLHVAGMPGNEPIGGDRAEPGAEVRGWIEPPMRPYDFLVGSHLFVLHHASGGPLKVSLDQNGVIGLDATGTRVRYRASTALGSSGAPCFDAGWELIALHEARDGDVAQGIPISLIVNDIERQGKGDALRVHSV